MRQLASPRHLFCATVASTLLAAALGSCGPNSQELWECNNPVNGKADPSVYDANHYVNGVFDPCHCYDPCGELPQCPLLINDGGPAPDAACGDAGADGP
jgi:hypothetical protein